MSQSDLSTRAQRLLEKLNGPEARFVLRDVTSMIEELVVALAASDTALRDAQKELDDWRNEQCRCKPWEGVHASDCPASSKQMHGWFLREANAKCEAVEARLTAVTLQEAYQQMSLHELRMLRLRIENEITARGAVVDGRNA